ncbi:DUF1150 family protein [Rhodoligotrophos defluvii]|uniref:BQ00720 family protein n=1 Tax=Rhodoligotrophos defluvii TaxID=2561934 RepID=UPI0010C94CB6|nr:DUF1150 family protein [Rhodoligotrophos defluvii]
MSAAEFALLGDGKIGYVREIDSTVAAELIGPIPYLPANARLFALYAADGTPMAIAGSREAALANAFENDLQTVSVN